MGDVIQIFHDLCCSVIVNMLKRTDVPPHGTQPRTSAEHYPSSAFVTHLVYLKGSMVTINVKEIHVCSITLIPVITGVAMVFCS